MARYIEYDIAIGHIISEIKADKPPEVSEGTALLELELEDNEDIEIARYVVKNGELQKIHVTNAEKLDQERIKQEYRDSVRLRVKSMMSELCLALLEDDSEEVARLRREYKKLKVYL